MAASKVNTELDVIAFPCTGRARPKPNRHGCMITHSSSDQKVVSAAMNGSQIDLEVTRPKEHSDSHNFEWRGSIRVAVQEVFAS